MKLKSYANFEEKLTCGLEKDLRINGILLSKVEKVCMTIKFTEEICVMTMKNNAKFEEKLTCHFKTDMRNLTNFDSSI